MNIYVPSSGPDDWQRFLAEPEKHWRPGFSAQAVAMSWESSEGVPPEIDAALGGDTELLMAIPEHKVALPGGQRASQCDVFALIRQKGRTIALAVEGKVREAFGPTLGEWYAKPSKGKTERLDFIKKVLGRSEIPENIPYQLLHRTTAAVVEAKRFKTDRAAMMVQSFAADSARFEEYAAFASFLGLSAVRPGQVQIVTLDGKPVCIGWVQGDLRHLTPGQKDADTLYDRDFHAWAEQQGTALRTRSLAEVDWKNLAEEIESVGRSERREISSRLKVLILHLLKWEFQPGRRSESWRSSISEQRIWIATVIGNSPSLKRYPEEIFEEEYKHGRERAIDETGMLSTAFPQDPPFSVAQALDSKFLPGEPFASWSVIRD